MSMVNTDPASNGERCPVQLVGGALQDEFGATALFDKLAQLIPEHAKDFEEIRNDELNHQGKLLKMIMDFDPTQMEPFNKGLSDKE